MSNIDHTCVAVGGGGGGEKKIKGDYEREIERDRIVRSNLFSVPSLLFSLFFKPKPGTMTSQRAIARGMMQLIVARLHVCISSVSNDGESAVQEGKRKSGDNGDKT